MASTDPEKIPYTTLQRDGQDQQPTDTHAAHNHDGDASSSASEPLDYNPEKETSGFPQRVFQDDIEAQQEGAPHLEPVKSNATQKSHRSVLSRLSRRKTQPAQPPPVLSLMDLDNGVVGWESQNDPDMPLNFTEKKKWTTVVFLSGITLMTPFASTILAPALQTYSEKFNSGLTLSSLAITIFLLGYAVAPLLLSPLSEIHGRYPILTGANAFFCVWLIGCALAPSLDTLIFFRFMAGVGGSACQTLGGGIIADLFPVHQRGKAMTIWMLGPLLGPSVAPLIAGFVVETIGWRWLSWLTFIPATIITVCMAIFTGETNHQVIMRRKTQRLRKELNRPELRSCYDSPDKPLLTAGRRIFLGLTRPIRMLFTSAIVFSASLYIAFAYGCLYLLFNTIPIVFEQQYHWSLGITGLVYISLLIGYSVGLGCFSFLSDRTVVRLTKANNGVYKPEMRLPHCMWFAVIFAGGFFWYGWAADQHTHWIVPIMGLVPFAIGLLGVWLPIQAYLVDAFPQYAASALAAFAVLRCTVAAFLPLAGPKMYDALGIGWGTSLLGFIAIALIPVPTLIYRYGGVMREKYPFKFE